MNFGVINHKVKEYREGDLAVRETLITFFGLPLYKFRKTSTNGMAVAQLTPIKEKPRIKGFNLN